MPVRGMERRDQAFAAPGMGHLRRVSAAYARLRDHGLPRGRRPPCRREQYAPSAGASGLGARACRDPAIPSRQHRHLADLRGFSRLVRAASVAAVKGAEPNPWRLAAALCARARFRLDRPGLAQQWLVLQSPGLAAPVRVGRVVGHRGEETAAMADLAHGAGACRSLSGFQPHPRIELEHQTACTAGPADSDASAFPRGQIESQSVAGAASPCSCDSGGKVCAANLARTDGGCDAWREALWRELAADLLPRRRAGARQPRGAAPHFGWACNADRAQSRWNPGDDRRRDASELDQDQTQAAAISR